MIMTNLVFKGESKQLRAIDELINKTQNCVQAGNQITTNLL